MDELDKYEEEVRQINEAIKLQNELQALLELTEQSENGATNSKSTDPLADEMALFMSEIKNMDNTAEDVSRSPEETERYELHLEAIKNELNAMIGKKCSAPHEHSWGAKTYHNAIICGLDDTKSYDFDDIKKFRLRILFTNPTHREMIPCSYFLDGDCKFDVDNCRFSHGELIPFGELKEYKEPEFSKLKRNCVVLAKMEDKLWHKGRVLTENFEAKTCRVRIDDKKKDLDFDFEDLFPIFHDDDLSSGSDSETDDYFETARHDRLVEQSLLNPAPNQALGEWEKYTKGIGSKLMQKMGYVVGTGLGTNGEGIIVPISAQVLPQGRSLDHCMELREAANGDQNLFNVERKMKKEQKKQEALSAKVYERESNKTDLFSFLNENIFTNGASTSDMTKNNVNKITAVKTKTNNYKNHTTKNLNVESVKLSDDIRKMERDINKIKDSMKRHSNSSEIYKRLKRTLDLKNEELNVLRKSESSLHKEQVSRKHKDKLSIF